MPFPIIPVKQTDRRDGPDESRQDISGLIPILVNPLTILQDFLNINNDKGRLKEVWLKSESQDDGSVRVASDIPERELWELKCKGLIDGDGRVVSFTEKGKKILKDAILGDEKSSFSKKASLVKKASRKLVAKNSYDFGNEVLVRVSNKEKYGTRYITISKKAFEESKTTAKRIDEYKVASHFDSGKPKSLKDYSEEELVQVLHLAKNVISNSKEITRGLSAQGALNNGVPSHRIKAFVAKVMEELNSR